MDNRSKWVIAFAVAAVAVIGLLARVSLGAGFNLAEILLGLMALGILLVLVARYPAAFIAPMLFTPRDKGLPFFHSQYGLDEYKALGVATALVVLAMLIRLLWPSHRSPLPAEALRDRRNGILAFLFFAAVISFSYLYSPAQNYGGDKLWRFLVYGGLAFFAPFLLVRSEEDFRDFTIGTVLFAMPLAVSSLRFSHQGRIGPTANIVHIGVGQVIGLAILVLSFQPMANKRLRALALITCLPLLALGLPSAEARGPLFSVVIALLVYLAIPTVGAHAIPRKQLALVVIVVAAAVFGLSAYWFQGQGAAASRLHSKTSELVEIFTGSIQVEGSAVERLAYYQAAPAEFLHRPLLGLGVGGWSVDYFHQDARMYPHNLLIEVAVEEGMVGLAALLLFLGTIFFAFKRNAAAVASHFPALFPALIYLFFLTMFSGDIVGNRFLWFWCGLVLAGCEIALASQSVTEQESEEGGPLESANATIQD